MTNFEKITASPETLGTFLASCPLRAGRGTRRFIGRSATDARRRTATRRAAHTRRSGTIRCGG